MMDKLKGNTVKISKLVENKVAKKEEITAVAAKIEVKPK
jgi:hypothetical protein